MQKVTTTTLRSLTNQSNDGERKIQMSSGIRGNPLSMMNVQVSGFHDLQNLD